MKKKKIKKHLNKNQQSFFFEDYLSTNQKFRKDFNKVDGRIFNKITFKNFINNFFSIYSG